MHNLFKFAEQSLKKMKKSPIEESNQNSEMSIDIDSEPLINQCHEYSCKY